MKLYLQNTVEDISFENLPIQWQGFDFVRFSKDKTLFDFQQNALKNALRGLWLFFKGNTPSEFPFYEGVSGEPDGVVSDTPLQEGNLNTPSLRDTPLQEGNELKQSLFEKHCRSKGHPFQKGKQG